MTLYGIEILKKTPFQKFVKNKKDVTANVWNVVSDGTWFESQQDRDDVFDLESKHIDDGNFKELYAIIKVQKEV